MSHMYAILAIVGWSWAILFFAYLFIRLSRQKPRGFDVVESHEKQP